MITLALTHFNRCNLLRECLAHAIKDRRIEEIVISDDASTDGSFERLKEFYKMDLQVWLHRNERNLDCYRNKAQVLRKCRGNWTILFDSDNILPINYIDLLCNHRPWNRSVAYLPVSAQPHFDYTAFAGQMITKANVASFMDKKNFTTALNTANYFFWRPEYLRVWDGDVDPHTADSIYQNYRWLSAGNSLFFVPGLQYFHRVHPDSHYKKNVHKTGDFAKKVEQMLRNLK